MALQKNPININFASGLDTKTDPFQVAAGKFLSLQNTIFTKGGLLQKRNGYGQVAGLSPNQSYLTTLNGNLLAIGNTVNALSSSLGSWITKGTLQPCSLSVLPLIRNNVNQTQCDSVVSNGLVCTTYTQTNTTNTAVNTVYLYTIIDSSTGQNIVQPSIIPAIAGGTITGSSRAFVVDNYFVVVSQVLVSSTTYLQYISIPISNPVLTSNLPNVSAPQKVTTDAYVPIKSNPGWDGVTANGTLVIAYNTTTGAQGIHVASLSAQQISTNISSTVIHSYANAAYIGAVVSVCVDMTNATVPVFYVSFWNNSTTNAYTAAVTIGFGSITSQFTPQATFASSSIVNLTSAAQNGSCLVYSEVANNYSYDSTIPSNYISAVTVSSAGTVGSPYVAIRSVGLASKAFIVNSTAYFLAAYQSTYQPTYFLINGSTSTAAAPVIVSKLAYMNGGGYVTLGLPSVTTNGSMAQLSYLYKDDVEALNTLNNPQQTTAGGIYSQTGINLVSFTLGTPSIATAEIAQNLHISGGYLSQFDGYLPVEHNFFVFPDNIECTYTASSAVTPTGTASSGSNTIVVSSATGISPGMTIVDSTNSSYIPTNTYVVLVSGTTVTMSNATTHAISGDTLSIQGNIAAIPTGGSAGAGAYYYQVVYEWTDNQGLPYRSAPSIPVPITTTGSGTAGSVKVNIPTLRLTAKTANAVKIVVYRWSSNAQVYNQVTSITAPVLNSTTVDSVSFVDNLPDANVVGNNILYTAGGVVPDCNAPSTKIMALFDTRLWLIDAENPNNAWVSKTVVPSTPVEMSQDFTIFVSPTTGVSTSLGPVTGMAPMDDKLIFFFKEGIAYINGIGPNALGTTQTGSPLGSYSQPIFIASTVGTINTNSIVLTPLGLMFQSDKGIWLLTRDLQTEYIGADVEGFNSQTVTSAMCIPGTNQVRFTLNNNFCLMYDYYYKQWGTFINVNALSSTIYQGLHTYINQYGQILQETPGIYLDGTNPVLIQFTTSWLNLAGLQGYERFYDFLLLATYISPHYLQVLVAYDYGPATQQSIIQPNNFTGVYGSDQLFGQTTPYGGPGSLEQWRIHTQRQTCSAFQISIQEIYNPAFGNLAGAGFTMSGLDLTVGMKKGRRPIKAVNSVG